MTQEAFKAWWYNEGSQAPYTHHDCEEHTMRMCEIAWANGAYKALAEHAMQEVQRLGQEIEQEPVAYPDGDVVGPCICGSWPGGKCLKCPRITTPPQRKPLTDRAITKVIDSMPKKMKGFMVDWDLYEFARAIEAAHGIKENT